MIRGRPPLYESVEEMEALIEEYFTLCDNRIQHVYSKKRDDVIEIINPEPYTIAGLAYALGMDRRTLLDYSKRKDFIPTVKRARNRIEMDVERRMNDREAFTPGLIFNAKNNFDWRDKSEQELTGKDGGPIETSTLTYMPKQLKADYFEQPAGDEPTS